MFCRTVNSIIQVTMNFYQQAVSRLNKELYPNDALVRQVMQSKTFIDKNFARCIDIADIAGEAFFSKFHFIRLFKSLYGRTPYQYLTSVRIVQAKKLLQKNVPVTAVCRAVGFCSTTSFSALFKKTTGSTPSAFQKKQGLSKRSQF
jgi:AraC-like DNA-binding protein